jgi:hypothetical protein
LFTIETLEGAAFLRDDPSSLSLGTVATMALDLEDAQRRYRVAITDEDRVRLPFYSALLTALERDEQSL